MWNMYCFPRAYNEKGKNLETLEVFVDHVIYRNESNGYCVLSTNHEEEELIVTGIFQGDVQGAMLRVTGKMEYNANYGEQFKMQQYEIIEPTDAESIRRYLGSGAIKGIGESLAGRIVKRFGDDSLRIIEEEPERLAEVKGISLRKAQEIAEQVEEKKDVRGALMFLQKYGIGNTLAVRIYKTYGMRMYGILQENPYQMAEDIDGVGFRMADAIAEKIGIRTDSDYRIRSGILYMLSQSMAEGNLYLPKEELIHQTAELLRIPRDAIEPHIANLMMDKKLVIKENCIYSMAAYYAENNVAAMLLSLRTLPEKPEEDAVERELLHLESRDKLQLDPLQRRAVIQSVQNGVFLLTGGPGTGKTTTINMMIRYFLANGKNLALTAPTGRAAKRMTEATGYEAKTIHRLLEVNAGGEDREMFERNEENPLEADVIIVDEMSMVDIFLMQSLLKAIPYGTRLILVGDRNQLPSVGPGQVMRDLLESRAFASVCLETIYRQSDDSDIIWNAYQIRCGKDIVLDNKSRDFFFLPRQDINLIYNNIVQLVTDKLPRYTKTTPAEIQVLTPMRKGPLGMEALNKILQAYVNPADGKKKENQFGERILREGDKVMQIRNNYKLEWEITGLHRIVIDKGIGVFNGDMGRISEINTYAKTVRVLFDDGREVSYGFDEMEELELAYAITVHKSQGSEYPAVVIPVFHVPYLLAYRNLLYTAVTRAKKCVTLIGSEETVHQMIENGNTQTRYTGLGERIREKIPGVEKEEEDITGCITF